MDFRAIFDTVPLGSIVSFSDGTPQPPKHHKKKLAAWENRNDYGRLTGKNPSARGDSFTLETSTYGEGDTIVMRIRKVFSEPYVTPETTFAVKSLPQPGSFAIISDSVHVGREWHAVRSTRALALAEKLRGYNVDRYVIVEIDADGQIIEPAQEIAA